MKINPEKANEKIQKIMEKITKSDDCCRLTVTEKGILKFSDKRPHATREFILATNDGWWFGDGLETISSVKALDRERFVAAFDCGHFVSHTEDGVEYISDKKAASENFFFYLCARISNRILVMTVNGKTYPKLSRLAMPYDEDMADFLAAVVYDLVAHEYAKFAQSVTGKDEEANVEEK